jgi:hypothetical protein
MKALITDAVAVLTRDTVLKTWILCQVGSDTFYSFQHMQCEDSFAYLFRMPREADDMRGTRYNQDILQHIIDVFGLVLSSKDRCLYVAHNSALGEFPKRAAAFFSGPAVLGERREYLGTLTDMWPPAHPPLDRLYADQRHGRVYMGGTYAVYIKDWTRVPLDALSTESTRKLGGVLYVVERPEVDPSSTNSVTFVRTAHCAGRSSINVHAGETNTLQEDPTISHGGKGGVVVQDQCSVCECDTSQAADTTLVCDGCDRDCHFQCVTPAVLEAPEGEWYCAQCVSSNLGQQKDPTLNAIIRDAVAVLKRDTVLKTWVKCHVGLDMFYSFTDLQSEEQFAYLFRMPPKDAMAGTRYGHHVLQQTINVCGFILSSTEGLCVAHNAALGRFPKRAAAFYSGPEIVAAASEHLDTLKHIWPAGQPPLDRLFEDERSRTVYMGETYAAYINTAKDSTQRVHLEAMSTVHTRTFGGVLYVVRPEDREDPMTTTGLTIVRTAYCAAGASEDAKQHARGIGFTPNPLTASIVGLPPHPHTAHQ